MNRGLGRSMVITLVASLATLLAAPSMSPGARLSSSVAEQLQQLESLTLQLVDPLTGKKRRKAAPARTRQQAQDPATQPPLHGADPHGQGSVAVLDRDPNSSRPLSGDPDGGESGEDVVVGRARGSQESDNDYHGHITVAALLGNEIVGVDTAPGESKKGPLNAVQTGLLNALCNGSGNQICLTVLKADSETTGSGSTNSFSTARATLGTTQGIDVGAAESNGNISDDGSCQNAHSDSAAADVNIGGGALADVAKSSTDSKACKSGAPTQTQSSSVIGLAGTGVPLPAAGCANGTPDTITGIPTLAPIVCNADDANGSQAQAPYGVREALSVFALASGSSSLLKALTAGAESHAVAPPPQCRDRRDNDGDGKIDFPADPGCSSRDDDDERDSRKPQCSDGRDNDGDGKVDFPADPGCSSRSDDSERDSANAKPECSDGRDNDGDGKVDFPADPGCSSRSDDSEENGPGAGTAAAAAAPECSDGIDNDGDGKIDFPDDPQCSSREDDSEADGQLPFTGTNVLLMLLLGTGTLGVGLGLRGIAASRRAAG